MINRAFSIFGQKATEQVTSKTTTQIVENPEYPHMQSAKSLVNDMLKYGFVHGETPSTTQALLKAKAASDLGMVVSPRFSKSGGYLFTTREEYPKILEEVKKEGYTCWK